MNIQVTENNFLLPETGFSYQKIVTRKEPHVRRAGEGPHVLCLHSSTASSKQWQTLIDLLAVDHHVIAPDLHGYGGSPDWEGEQEMTLHDEVDLLRPLLDDIPGSFHLIGHSYGAAVGFKVALACPDRIRSMTVYEPVLFNLLFDPEVRPDAGEEVLAVSDDVRREVELGNFDTAARRFVDYWTGDGSWERFPDWQKKIVSERMNKVVSDFAATIGNPTPLTEYSRLNIPTLFLYGLDSPKSTLTIADWLTRTLPQVEVRGLIGMGHMGPVTHAEQVHRLIAGFIRKQPKGILPHQVKRDPD